MSTPNDEPAFPNQPCDMQGNPIIEAHPGMSLRDYFFAAALQGLCANPHDNYVRLVPSDLVETANTIADEAMKQRK